MQQTFPVKKLTVISMICALAYLCMFVFRFKVGFLTFDIKDAVLAIASLLYGPLWGVISSGIVALLEMFTVSETGIYGCIMNFLSSASFTLVCGFIYKYKKNINGAVMGVSAGSLVTVLIMMVANVFITPYYMGVPRGEVVALIPALLLPFNAIKAVVNGSLTLLIYKPITSIMKRAGLLPRSNASQYRLNTSTVLLTIFSCLFLIGAIVILLYFLNGSFELFRVFE